MDTLKQLFGFVKKRKALWIVPLVLLLLSLGLLLYLAASPAAAPFIYTLF